MRNPVKNNAPRLKHAKGQLFSCGMFGRCSDGVLSPRTPPQIQIPQDLAMASCTPKQDRTISVLTEVQEKLSTDCLLAKKDFCGSAEKCIDLIPAGTQWDFSFKQQDRSCIKDSYVGLIRRELSPPQQIFEAGSGEECGLLDLQGNGNIAIASSATSSRYEASVSFIKSLRSVAQESASEKLRMVEEGLPEKLVSTLISGDSSRAQEEAQTMEEAFGLLVLLADDEKVMDIAVQTEMLPVVERFIKGETLKGKVDAGVLLVKISAVEGLNIKLGAKIGLLEGVVKLIRQSDTPRLVKLGIKALLGLCLSKENRAIAVKAGAVEALLEMLSDLKGVCAERALASMELLCTTSEGKNKMINNALAIPTLVSMILSVSDRGTEYAAGVLCALCTSENTEAQETAVQAGASTQLLLLLQSDCTERARRKASKLLKVLHKFCEDKSFDISCDLTNTILY